MKTSRNTAQWFKAASTTIGGAWQYQGDTGTRGHQLLMRYGRELIKSGCDIQLIWHDEPITKRALTKLYADALPGTIIAGEGYGVHTKTQVNKVVDAFAESQGISVEHNRSEPAIWWIHKEKSDEPADHKLDEAVSPQDDTTDVSGSTLPGDQ